MKTDFLLLYGFGWSGSGAVLDLLKEVDCIDISDNYFFLIRDYGGIIDLKNSLVDNWDVFRSSSAIKNFLRLCKRSKKKMLSFFTVAGRDYKRQFGKKFDQEVASFISKITFFKYYCYEHSLNMDKNYFNTQRSRLVHNLDKIGIKIPICDDDMYFFGRPSEETFNLAVNELISNLYNIYESNKKYLLIDHHPVSIHDFSYLESFFGKGTKMIVVDRDPRDIYCDLVDNRMRIGSELYRYNSVDKYIVWHKKTREFVQSDNVLYVRFENLVTNYDIEVKRIFSFLNIDYQQHSKKRLFFNPDVSMKNIGIWKKRYEANKEIFNKIYNELREYCWEGEKIE